jgi:glutathione S-transferase
MLQAVTLRYHYARPTCSLAGMIALELAGADYMPLAVDMAGDREALRALNPTGRVPVLEGDEAPLTDTVAIIYWIARRFPHARLLPDGEDAVARSISTMAWFGNVVHILRRRFTRPQMFAAGAEAQIAVKEAARAPYWDELRRIDAWLEQGAILGQGPL